MAINKLSQLIIGPELLWTLFYLVVILLINVSSSPVKSMDNFWVSSAWWVPLLLVPLTFLLYYVPGVMHSWLLLRIWIACVVGGHLVLNRSLLAHSEQGPGVGTAYMMGIFLLFVPLIVGTIWARIKF